MGVIEKKFHNNGYSLILEWTESNVNISNNTSDITVVAKLKSNSSSYNINSSASKNISLTINGTTYNGTCTVGLSGGATKALMTKTVTIAHNADGSKAVSLSCTLGIAVTLSGTYYSSVSTSGTATLTTIARKSSLSASNGTLGVAQNLTVSRQSTAFTHTITYSCGEYSGTVCTKSSATSVSFTPPLDFATGAPNGTSVYVAFTIETFNGNTSLGKNSTAIWCSIPDYIIPSVSITIVDDTGYAEKYGKFIQGISKIYGVVFASGTYYSRVDSVSTSVEGKVYTGYGFTTDTITSGEDIEVTTVVKDSRTRTNVATATASVYKYNPPAIKDLNIRRVNEAGEEDASGTYIQVGGIAECTHLGHQAEPTIMLYWKKTTDETYSNIEVPQGESGWEEVEYWTYFSKRIDADANASYEVKVEVSDEFKSISKTVVVSSAKKAWSLFKKGLGFAFGKIAELENVLDIAFQTRFAGGILQPVLPSGSDFDDQKIPNTYTLKDASNYVNCPFSSGSGTLTVEESGENGKIHQIAKTHSLANPMVYERHFDTKWSEWTKIGGVYLEQLGSCDYTAKNVDETYTFESDGYVCPVAQFSATSGYVNFMVMNEANEIVFRHQLVSSPNANYMHYGPYLPVLKGWSYKFTSSSNVNYVHIYHTYT